MWFTEVLIVIGFKVVMFLYIHIRDDLCNYNIEVYFNGLRLDDHKIILSTIGLT